jgi:hypothetical protein
MHVTRFSAGDDGESQFTDVTIDHPRERDDGFGHTITSSGTFGSPLVQFALLPEGLDQSWHPAPRRQLVAILAGHLEVGTPDGARRAFGPGDVFLADDVGTRGHTTRTVGGPVQVLFAPVPEDAKEIWSTTASS